MVDFLNDPFQDVIQRIAKLEEAQERTDEWQKTQNGAIGELGHELKLLRKDMNDGFTNMNDRLGEWKDELKDLIYRSREKASESDTKLNEKRDAKFYRRISVVVAVCAILVSVTGVIVNLLR